MKNIIGDYQGFFSDLLHRLKKRGVAIHGMPIVQLLYRAAAESEYVDLRERLKPYCKEFVETLFNGRAVSILILREPLVLEGGFSVSVIELAAPRLAHMYPSGLESVGILLGSKLSAFKEEYQGVLTGVKEHGRHCQPAFFTFENGKTVKFYDHTLEEIILLQGWRFEQVGSPDNRTVELVNAWRWFFYSIGDWRDLIVGKQPIDTGCGAVYGLPNPIDRPEESLAIVEMKKPTQAHYHNGETEIYFVLEGKGFINVDGKEEFVEKDATVIIPPGATHFTLPQDKLVVAVVSTPPFKKENYCELR